MLSLQASKDLLDSLKNSIKKRPLFYTFGCVAFIFHISFIFLFYSKPISKINPDQKKLIVKTHQLPKEYVLKDRVVTQVKKTAQKNTTPQTSASQVKKSPAKTKNPSASSQKSKTKQILNHLQESLAKIETSKEMTHKQEAMIVPESIRELKADQYQISPEEACLPLAYQQVLVSFLKNSLELPAFGTVKLSITIKNEGILKNLSILFSDSEINRLYLESHLSLLIFPSFTAELVDEKEHTFTLTFCSK